MSVRDTIDWGKARRAMEAAGAELLERMGRHMEGAAKRFCPVDTGALWNSITLVSAGGQVGLVSGSVVNSLDAGDAAQSVSVVAYENYALYVEYGHFAGKSHRWVPPNPFMRNALADTIASFSTIVNAEVFAPFRGEGGWGEIDSGNAGSANTFSPLKGPQS